MAGFLADVEVVKLEHYGPPGQRVLLEGIRKIGEDFQMGRMLSRHTGAAAYILSRRAAQVLLAETRFDLPVDHLLFNPNNSSLFAALSPWQLVPPIARQQEFVGEKSDIENTRKGLRDFSWTYVKRELVRLAYDLQAATDAVHGTAARREIRGDEDRGLINAAALHWPCC